MNMNLSISSDPKEAAIQFIDEMIPHHKMALEMVNNFYDKVENTDLISIMDNILTSQKKQIDQMKEIKNAIENSKHFNFINAIRETNFLNF
jgi:uncharacterized protein (DUF305 family)